MGGRVMEFLSGMLAGAVLTVAVIAIGLIALLPDKPRPQVGGHQPRPADGSTRPKNGPPRVKPEQILRTSGEGVAVENVTEKRYYEGRKSIQPSEPWPDPPGGTNA